MKSLGDAPRWASSQGESLMKSGFCLDGIPWKKGISWEELPPKGRWNFVNRPVLAHVVPGQNGKGHPSLGADASLCHGAQLGE